MTTLIPWKLYVSIVYRQRSISYNPQTGKQLVVVVVVVVVVDVSDAYSKYFVLCIALDCPPRQIV